MNEIIGKFGEPDSRNKAKEFFPTKQIGLGIYPDEGEGLVYGRITLFVKDQQVRQYGEWDSVQSRATPAPYKKNVKKRASKQKTGSSSDGVFQAEIISLGPMVTVTGVLLNPDKSYATGVWVEIFESKEKGSFNLLLGPPKDGASEVLHQTKTNVKGRFTIRVSRAFLETHQAVLCVNRNDNMGITPQYPGGKPFIIRAPLGNTLNLGEVTIVSE